VGCVGPHGARKREDHRSGARRNAESKEARPRRSRGQALVNGHLEKGREKKKAMRKNREAIAGAPQKDRPFSSVRRKKKGIAMVGKNSSGKKKGEKLHFGRKKGELLRLCKESLAPHRGKGGECLSCLHRRCVEAGR